MLHLFVKFSASLSLSTVGVKEKDNSTKRCKDWGGEGGIWLTPIGRFLNGGWGETKRGHAGEPHRAREGNPGLLCTLQACGKRKSDRDVTKVPRGSRHSAHERRESAGVQPASPKYRKRCRPQTASRFRDWVVLREKLQHRSYSKTWMRTPELRHQPQDRSQTRNITSTQNRRVWLWASWKSARLEVKVMQWTLLKPAVLKDKWWLCY